MRIPLTKYGLPEVVAYPVGVLALMAAVAATGIWILPTQAVAAVEIFLLAVLLWILAFFRDPNRQIPAGSDILLSPADGKITDIEVVRDEEFIGTQALRIGIFLDIFNVHINRTPCAVKIDEITYKKGLYKNALNSESARVNESNAIVMTRIDAPNDKLLVRQISGAIARRIVCHARIGQDFTGGQSFGMIKFGSRTELYLPMRNNVHCLVKPGDKVKAGLTILVRYQKCQNNQPTGQEKEICSDG